MKVGDFCKAIHVSNNAYNRFMQHSGATKGMQSDVFMAATEYFAKRDKAGLKLPTANSKNKKAKTDSAGGKAAGGGGSKAADFLQLELPGEATDNVPVYDTCADVRRKISAWLREPGVTQAQFMRDLHAQLHGADKGPPLKTNTLQRFRGKSGANEGGHSKVFYTGYVFFEKKRVFEKKPKSKKRVEMERIWPDGVDRETFGRVR